jgi:hypothetical protein
MHASGISAATLHYKSSIDSTFLTLNMTNISSNQWAADIPAQTLGSTIEYYISAVSNSGKSQVRPLTAPSGHFQFSILNFVDIADLNADFGRVFPNPSSGLTCIEINNSKGFNGALELFDMLGKKIATIHDGIFIKGDRKYFIDLSSFENGAYILVLTSQNSVKTSTIFKN